MKKAFERGKREFSSSFALKSLRNAKIFQVLRFALDLSEILRKIKYDESSNGWNSIKKIKKMMKISR